MTGAAPDPYTPPADHYLTTELPKGVAAVLVRYLDDKHRTSPPMFSIGDRWWTVEGRDDDPTTLLMIELVDEDIDPEPTGHRALVKITAEYVAGVKITDGRHVMLVPTTPGRTGVPPATSPEFVRGWHEGYRDAKDDALRVARHGGRDARAVFGRLVDWNDGLMPSDFAPTAAPVAVDQEVPR